MRKELLRLATTAPLHGYIYSGHFAILDLKEKYNKSDYYVVELLEKMLAADEIKELDVNYDKDDQHILSYKFR